MKKRNQFIMISILLLIILMLPLAGCDELDIPGTGDGSLSALALSVGTLSPDFDPDVTEYAVTLATGTASIIITPTASDPLHVIEIDGVVVASGTEAGSISLSEGLNTVVIELLASDDTLLNTYTLKIIVGGFKVSGTMTLTNGEDAGGKSFMVGVTSDISTGDDEVFFEGIWDSGSTQSFEISGVVPGTYYLYALIDWNDDDSFDGLYPDYGGLYGWAFDSLDSFLQTGDPPGDANLTVTDSDVSANVSDIQQIPDTVTDGTITVNLINANGHTDEIFGFAVYENDDLSDYVADGYGFIASDGTSGSIAYVDSAAATPVEYIATGGDLYDIYVLVDVDSNGVTSNGDYTGMIQDVYVNGDMTVTADYNDMAIYTVIE